MSHHKMSWSAVAKSPKNKSPSPTRQPRSPQSASGGGVAGAKRVYFDVKMMGMLIGKRGVTIQGIQKTSGARVLLKEDKDKGLAVISGTDEQVGASIQRRILL